MGQSESSTSQDGLNNQSDSIAKIDEQDTFVVSTHVYDHQLSKRCEHIDFDVEGWYHILEYQTFHTEFISISPSTARAFVNYYQTRYNSKRVFNTNDLRSIQSIQHQLNQKIFNLRANQFQSSGNFIRLSSRSPKDGNPLDSQKLVQLYHQEFENLKLKYPNEYDSIEGKANMQLIAYSNAQMKSLKVTNEVEALNLILSSERVFIDLLEALDCQDAHDNKTININNRNLYDWSTKIIIREWNNLLDPSMEFRCFVYDSNLTAISQYNHYCKFYPLQNDITVQNIKNTIIQYWQQKIEPLLDPFKEKYSKYIIDIGLIENSISNEMECVVIELNPFARGTGAGLFHWTTDIQQLIGQKDEIEIRVRSNYLTDIDHYVEFILRENKLNIENSSSSDDEDHTPYFAFLDKMEKQFSS
ncbi:unnamed protein product [Rotaria magnacalcarata]|uniref:Cell division cycle protein 123 homolog n=2 Tax=Rotaria magnacalcarata TaxID=392030 RepID=A0A820G626_9BILA|nr:unnamed protein product [Rotaria magnacalcarata]CAF4272920.1 unnamed protein product [Rotaria magnacalcarata]